MGRRACIVGDIYEDTNTPVEFDYGAEQDGDRADPVMIEAFHKLGSAKFSGSHAEIRFQPLVEGSRYRIQEYDGLEWVKEPGDIEWKGHHMTSLAGFR